MKVSQWSSVVLFAILFFIYTPLYSAKDNLPAIIKKIQPSVVVVLTYDEEGKALSQGSGFFISEKGDIITNLHVIKGATKAQIKTSNDKTYIVKDVLAEDIESDLVRLSTNILKNIVNPLSIKEILPEVGEKIIVIGCPLGLEQTVSDGIVSAIRELPNIGKVIQITAPISHGSSGSPVVNMKGEVIGVASLQISEGQNLNFAIQSSRVINLKSSKKLKFAEWSKISKQRLATLAEISYSEGLTYFWKGEYEKALPFFKKAVTDDPEYSEAYYLIGKSNIGLGKLDEAVESFKEAIRINPSYSDAYLGIGVAFKRLEFYKEAIDSYKRAIKHSPDSESGYILLGLCYYHLEQWNEVSDAFKKAISINPDVADAYGYLGIAYGKLGKWNEALKAHEQEISINDGSADSYKNLGCCYAMLNRHKDATEAFKKAIFINPKFAEGHYCLGLSYIDTGETAKALDEYKILKKLDEDLAKELFNLIYK